MNRSRLSDLVEIRTVKPNVTRRTVRIFRQGKNPLRHAEPAIEVSFEEAEVDDSKEGISLSVQSSSADETKDDLPRLLRRNFPSTQQNFHSAMEEERRIPIECKDEPGLLLPETSVSCASSQFGMTNPQRIVGLPAEMLMKSISQSVKSDAAKSTLKRKRLDNLSVVSNRPTRTEDDYSYLNQMGTSFDEEMEMARDQLLEQPLVRGDDHDYLNRDSLEPVHKYVQEMAIPLPGRGHSILTSSAKITLIDLVKEQEIIWNKQCDHFFDSIGRSQRDLAWLSVADEMQLTDVDSLKACWKRMAAYCKEMEQLQQTQNREPVWDLWVHLEFLRCPSTPKTKSKCNNEKPAEKFAPLSSYQRVKLIKAVKCQPEIWDMVNCAGYHDDRRDNAWEAVSDIMSLSAHCKDSWMRLRSNFSHRYRHWKAKLLQTGMTPEDLPKPSSAHYEELEFLTAIFDFTHKNEDFKSPAEIVSFDTSLRSVLLKEIEKYPAIWKSDQSTKLSEEHWNEVAKTMEIPKDQLRRQWARLRNYCLRLIDLEKHPKVRKRHRVFPPWEHWSDMVFFRNFMNKMSPKKSSKNVGRKSLKDEPSVSSSADPEVQGINAISRRKSIRIAGKGSSQSQAVDSNCSDSESSFEGTDFVQDTHSSHGEFIGPTPTRSPFERSSGPPPATSKSKKRICARNAISKGFSVTERQKLIEFVRQSEVIWNDDMDDGRRCKLVAAAWRAIGQMLDKSGRFYIDVCGDRSSTISSVVSNCAMDCRNQWWRLRAAFKGRLKSYEMRKKSETNSNDSSATEPKWVHWNEMQFIRDHWNKRTESVEQSSSSRQAALLCHSCGLYVEGVSDSEPLVHILKKHFQKPQYRCQHCEFIAKQTFAEIQRHIYSTHMEHYEPLGTMTKHTLLQAALTEVQHMCFPGYPRILQLASARSAISNLMSTMLKNAESKTASSRSTATGANSSGFAVEHANSFAGL